MVAKPKPKSKATRVRAPGKTSWSSVVPGSPEWSEAQRKCNAAARSYNLGSIADDVVADALADASRKYRGDNDASFATLAVTICRRSLAKQKATAADELPEDVAATESEAVPVPTKIARGTWTAYGRAADDHGLRETRRGRAGQLGEPFVALPDVLVTVGGPPIGPEGTQPLDIFAESKGFEPLVAFTTPDFESGTFGHSVSSPPRKFVDRAAPVKQRLRSGDQGAIRGRSGAIRGAAGRLAA